MKGFMLNKKDEVCLKNNQFKYIYKDVFSEDAFDNITIGNPTNSNRIYIINNIYIQSENEEFYLRIGEKFKKAYDIKEKDNFLFVEGNTQENHHIYVTKVKKHENKEVELLQKGSIILLPQGYLNIKVEKPINYMKIKLHVKEENIH